MSFRSPHLSQAHDLWRQHLQPGDWVLDATCGNGHDTLFAARCVLDEGRGKIVAVDLQENAILKARERLRAELTPELLDRVLWKQRCHSKLKDLFEDSKIHLAIYNLGYLPGGDKTCITQTHKTLSSLNEALSVLNPERGAISITCYPGHKGGDQETEAVLEWAAALDSAKYFYSFYSWPNRHRAPCLLFIKQVS